MSTTHLASESQHEQLGGGGWGTIHVEWGQQHDRAHDMLPGPGQGKGRSQQRQSDACYMAFYTR